MFWQEDDHSKAQHLPQKTVDLLFEIKCRTLPVDHIQALSRALEEHVPELKTQHIGVHSIHGAGSQNGWERPEHSKYALLLLSKRTKLILRVPVAVSEQVQHQLSGKTLDIDGYMMNIGKAKQRALTPQSTLYARAIYSDEADEMPFLKTLTDELASIDIQVKKALCGKSFEIDTNEGKKLCRSLLLADLSNDESVYLQEHGVGDYYHLGCGIFIGHKGITAVKNLEDAS